MYSGWPSIPIARNRILAGLRDMLARHVPIQRLLAPIQGDGKHWAIVGGAPRHWALEVQSYPTDFDIVVGMTPSELHQTILRWLAERPTVVEMSVTALGGHRITASNWAVDIWPTARTVGIANGLVADSKRFRAVSRSAALSLDSIVVSSLGTLYEKGFFRTLETGVLSMNHCVIERPQKVAEKAVRLCDQFRLVPDMSVQALIASFYGRAAVERLLEAGTSH
jgi:hypothetical protein